MNGQLHEHPLGELINEISFGRISGALRVSRERVRGVVYFDEGRIVSARTNLRSARLVEFLRRSGALTSAQINTHVKEGMTDEQAAAALVGAGALNAEELQRYQSRQAEEVLRLLLSWTDGEWSFDASVRLEANLCAPLNVRQMLIEAARQLPSEFVALRIERGGETISPSADMQDLLTAFQLVPSEGFVLSRVNAPMSISELLAISGLREPEAHLAVYALALGGLLTRAAWPRAFTNEEVTQARRARVATKSADAPAETPNSAPPVEEPQSPVEAEEKIEANLESEIEELFARSDAAASYYGVLGVTRNVKADEIKRAYYALARRFHPDRFRSATADDAMRRRIETSFSRILQAYETLKDSATRAGYDLKLEREKGRAPATSSSTKRADESAPQQTAQNVMGAKSATDAPHASVAAANSAKSAPDYRAEDCYQQGLAALDRKDFALAKRYLGEAALLVPHQPRYRALYGRVLAHEKQTRRQAEAEFQAAIKLDERNASYRVMLAELYRDLGLRRRAEGELERALSVEPTHAVARIMLNELRGGG